MFSPTTTQGLLRVSASGGKPEPASKLDTAQAENSHRWPFFFPDGKHFLYWSRNSRAGEPSVLYVGELGTLQAKVLMKSETMAIYAAGHLLFLRGQTLMAQPFNPSRFELSGEPVPIAEHVAINGASVRAMFSASNTGTLIYQTGEMSGGWNMVWWGRDGKQISTIPQSGRYLGPVLSPDGSKAAVEIFAGAQGIGDIWIFDLTRGTSTRLTFGPFSQGNPVWSSDGKTVYYASGSGEVYIVAKAADGSTAERIVLQDKGTIEIPDGFSPDGRYLIYERKVPQNETTYHLWALPLFPSLRVLSMNVSPRFLRTENGWLIRATSRAAGKFTSRHFPAVVRSGRSRALAATRQSGAETARKFSISTLPTISLQSM